MIAPSSHTRPFVVHFLNHGEPDHLLVLAKSPCHAVQVMFRYFETFLHTIDNIEFNRDTYGCFVQPLYYFSDSLYNHLKKQHHGYN